MLSTCSHPDSRPPVLFPKSLKPLISKKEYFYYALGLYTPIGYKIGIWIMEV